MVSIKILLFLILLPVSLYAQEIQGQAEEIMINKLQWKEVEADQGIDSVYQYIGTYLGIPIGKTTPQNFEAIVTDFQTFTTQEIYNEFKKAGREFYNVYNHEHCFPAKWNITLSKVNNKKTIIRFQLRSFYVDKHAESYQYARTYLENSSNIVSNDNLEGLIRMGIRAHFAAQSIASVSFSREEGYDNTRYKFEDFVPGNKFEEKRIFNKAVPEKNKPRLENSIIIYSKDNSTLLSLDLQKLKINWKLNIPFAAGEQNQNGFTVYDNIIYLPVNNGNLSAIDANTGEIYWQCAPQKYGKEQRVAFFGQYAPISGDMVYVNDDKYIYAYNRFDGKVIWSQKHGGYGHYNYSFDDQYLYKSGILELFKIDKHTGEVNKIINSLRANTFYFPNLLLNDKLLLCDGNIYYFDLKADTIIWQKDTDYDYIQKSEDSKSIFLSSNQDEGEISAWETRTGNTLWSCKIPAGENEHAEVADFKYHKGKLYILTRVNRYNPDTKIYKLLILNTSNGKTMQNLLLNNPPISNIQIDNSQVNFLTASGIFGISTDDLKVSEKKFDLSFLKPENDYQTNYIQLLK